MALIQIQDLTFIHDDGRKIFEHVSLRLDSNWKLGLIGRNGRGKTTLLRLLHGDYPCGNAIRSSLRMEYFPYAVPDPGLCGAALLRRICPEAQSWQWQREASLLELPLEALERPFRTLSGGEAVKLLLAGLFLRENSFALIDEPTDHLDLIGRQVLGRYLRAKTGFILVSHDRALLDACIDHTLSINRADIELLRGNFSVWQSHQQMREQSELAENERLKKEISRLEESARRCETWSNEVEKTKFGKNAPDVAFLDRGYIGHKAAKMMKRAKNVEKRRLDAAEAKTRLLRNVENSAPVSMRPLRWHGRRLAELRGVSLAYAGKEVLRDFSCEIMNGERLAVRGKNGCGKSTLLRLLGKELAPQAGELRLPPGLRLSLVPQDCSFVRGSLKHFARDQGVDEALLRAVLHRLGFERNQFDTDMRHFSAGQQKKAVLAASLCSEAHLYIWDEPLNYVDIISRMQIEELILEYQPTMIFVEHDQAFLQRVSTSVLDMDQLSVRPDVC